MIDGEVVALDESGRPSFAALQNVLSAKLPLYYYVFDVVTWRGDDLPEPRTARRGEALTADVMKKCRWLKPEFVAQIEFTEWTQGNHLRHSRFAGLRDDKDPRDVHREL